MSDFDIKKIRKYLIRRFNYFLKGFISGFFGAGPVLFFLWIYFNANPSILRFIPSAKTVHIKTSDYLFFLIPRIQANNNKGGFFVFGSSEFESKNNEKSIPELISSVSIQSKNRFVFADTSGSSITKLSVLLYRLNKTGIFPKNIILVINPFYLSAANQFHEQYYRVLFSDRFQTEIILHDPILKQSLISDDDKRFSEKLNPFYHFYLRFQSARTMIDHRLIYPVYQKFYIRDKLANPAKIRNDFKNNAQPFNSVQNKISNELKNKWAPVNDFSDSHAGRMLALLNNELVKHPEINIKVLMLPVNKEYIASMKFNPEVYQKYYENQIHFLLGSRPNCLIQYTENLQPYFTDSSHFTENGRKKIAGILLRTMILMDEEQ